MAKNFVLFRPKPFVWNLISYSQIDQKPEKLEKTIERPVNHAEEFLVWKLISYIFEWYESYKIKFPTKISSFTVVWKGGPTCIWKPLRMDWRGSIASKRDWLFSPRLPEMETEKCSSFPFTFSFVHRLYCWAPHTQSLSIVRRSITLHAGTSCEEFTWLRSKISWDIWQISCEIGDCRRRSHRKLWKKIDGASRFESFFSLLLER